MRKLAIIALLVSSVAYAHPKSEQEKKEVYEFIQEQLENDKIDVKTAQKMWMAYLRCCKD